jgi:hypothetical protein
MWYIPKQRLGTDERAAALAAQLEDILHQVWECERWSRVEDRLDLAARLTGSRPTARSSV